MERSRYLREHYLENTVSICHLPLILKVNEKEEQLQKDRDVIAERIRALGEVNSGAIEEYERLAEEYCFLKTS